MATTARMYRAIAASIAADVAPQQGSAARVARQHDLGRVAGGGVAEVGHQRDAEDELERGRVQRHGRAPVGNAAALRPGVAPGRAAEIAMIRAMFTTPIASAEATVASNEPRHRKTRFDREQDAPPTPRSATRWRRQGRAEADQRHHEADRVQQEQRRGEDGIARPAEVVADQPAEVRRPVAHVAVPGDRLDQRRDREDVDQAEDDEEGRRRPHAEPGEGDRQGEDPAADGLGQGQREGEPERRQVSRAGGDAAPPPAQALAKRQRATVPSDSIVAPACRWKAARDGGVGRTQDAPRRATPGAAGRTCRRSA